MRDAGVPASELRDAPAADVPSASHACHQRVLEREGIAMFVALHDARPGRHLVVRDSLGGAEGELLADLFDHYEKGLDVTDDVDPGADHGADLDDDPTGAAALIDVLVVLSDQHLRARAQAPA